MTGAELVHAYRDGAVNNGDEVDFMGEQVEVIGTFHRDEDDRMYLGLLVLGDSLKTYVVAEEGIGCRKLGD